MRDKNGRFVKGFKHTEESKIKIGLASKGNNHGFRGDNILDRALHHWVRKYLPIPEDCQMCGENKKLDLANVTGIYNREFKNWKYFCRKCHIAFDGNVYKAWITKRLRKSGDRIVSEGYRTRTI